MTRPPSIETSRSHPGVLVAGGDWTLAHSDRMLDLLDAFAALFFMEMAW